MGTTKKKKPEPAKTTKKAAPAAAPAPAPPDPTKALKDALQVAENKIVALEADLFTLTPQSRLEALKMALQLLLLAIRPAKKKAEPWDALAAAAATLTEKQS